MSGGPHGVYISAAVEIQQRRTTGFCGWRCNKVQCWWRPGLSPGERRLQRDHLDKDIMLDTVVPYPYTSRGLAEVLVPQALWDGRSPRLDESERQPLAPMKVLDRRDNVVEQESESLIG